MGELLSVAGATTIVALLFTLLFQYLPGLRTSWATVGSEVKKVIILALYVVVGAIVAFGGCVPAFKEFFPTLLCVVPQSFLTYLFAVVVAVGAGQGVFGLLPEVNDVTVAKAVRDEVAAPPIPVAGQ